MQKVIHILHLSNESGLNQNDVVSKSQLKNIEKIISPRFKSQMTARLSHTKPIKKRPKEHFLELRI